MLLLLMENRLAVQHKVLCSAALLMNASLVVHCAVEHVAADGEVPHLLYSTADECLTDSVLCGALVAADGEIPGSAA